MCLVLALLVPLPAVAAPQGAPPEQAGKPRVTEQEVGGRIVVTGDTVVVVGDPDLPPSGASVAGKLETPLIETPHSVSVTERRTLDDRAATNISNAHDYTVGVMPADERGPAFARGFPVSFYDLRRDGLRTYAWSVREPVAIERVQYLRGPASILYGDGSPGALVNMVLKKPLPVQRVELSASGGGLGFGRVTGDVTGPVGDSRQVRYRFIGAAEWLENGFDNDERRLSFLPAMSFDVGRGATLSVDGELYHQRGRNYRHTVPVTADTQHGDFSSIPWDVSVASPDGGWSGWNVSPGARLDWQLRPGTSLHSALRYTRIGGRLDAEALLALAADGRTLNRYHYVEQSDWHEWQSDTFAATTATTGPLEHRIVVGMEAGLSKADSLIGIGAAPSIDMYAPAYTSASSRPPLRPSRYDVLRLGVYAQDQLRLHRTVIVVPGLRWSRVDVEDRVTRSELTSPEQRSEDMKLSPTLGVVVLPRSWLSMYGSASRGFEPPAPGQYLEDGRALSLADTTSLEAGLKVAAFDGRMTASGAVFGIRRTNIPEADARGFYRQIGEGRSRGVELELAGRVANGLFLQMAYAWTGTEIARGLSGEGHDLPNAPRHNASVWARYRGTTGRWAGLMVSAGAVHVSDRFIAADNVVVAPAYTRLDLSSTYELPNRRARLGLAVPNATNRRYVTSGAGQILWAGPPRQVVVQMTTWF